MCQKRAHPSFREIPMRTPYVPKPIDTSSVSLTPEILALTERLAENTHDLWAQQRISQGWTFGEQRDDELKLHPCLVPYSELPDSEKELDRTTALEALKAILAAGYEIVSRD
jgi:ryanodine receptor 2